MFDKERYHLRIEENLCVVCGEDSPLENRRKCATCTEKNAVWRKSCSAASKAKMKAAVGRYQQRHHRYILDKQKERNAKLRLSILEHYGGRCACCGEDDEVFLVIDHINNDGGQQRRKIFGRTRTNTAEFYYWIRRNNYPDDLQILCWNCNAAKAFRGMCPHKCLI